jgi:hypothetical protein
MMKVASRLGAWPDMKNRRHLIALTLPVMLAAVCIGSGPAYADVNVGEAQNIQKHIDLGTNPTKMSHALEIKDEYLWLNGGVGSNILRLGYTMPFGQNLDWSVKVTLPVASLSGVPGNPTSIGDVGLKLTHVLSLTKAYAWAGTAEVLFNTADDGLGYGQDAVKLQLFHVRFLKNGALFAPTLVQTNGLGGNAELNVSTVDFYYVPKLANPKILMTFDPSITYDWANNRPYAGLSVTAGRVVGKALGGNAIIFVKPSAFAGNDRPGDWGIELGFKVVGF